MDANHDRQEYPRKAWRLFISEALQLPHYTLFDLIHGYVYSRWIYLYIAVGTASLPLMRWWNRKPNQQRGDAGSRPGEGAFQVSQKGPSASGVPAGYHGKVVTLEAARELVTVREDIHLPDLENVVPYSRARDIILLNPDHLAVLDCPCRSAKENPCLPLDVCLIVGEPFASLVLEKHPSRSRRISAEEACSILQAEDKRGHVHHAFFKDAMLGHFYAICNCCACCCGAMSAQRNGTPMLASSGYICEVNPDDCTGCGTCVELCQFGAIRVEEGVARVDENSCMGCGVCLHACQAGAMNLRREPSRGEPLELQRLMSAVN